MESYLSNRQFLQIRLQEKIIDEVERNANHRSGGDQVAGQLTVPRVWLAGKVWWLVLGDREGQNSLKMVFEFWIMQIKQLNLRAAPKATQTSK